MKITRRKIFKALGASGVTYALGKTIGSGFSQMSGVDGFSDYKALVCVFLFGGNDAWNTVIPTSAESYGVYAKSRGIGTPYSLAVDRSEILPLENSVGTSEYYGMHPELKRLQRLYNSGSLAVLPNVGVLLRPTTKNEYLGAKALNHELPPQLFSHNDQQDQWNSLRGNRIWTTGWAGRLADVLASRTRQQQVPLNISLTGQTLFQASSVVDPYVLGGGGVNTFEGYCCGPSPLGRRYTADRMLVSAEQSRVNTYYHRAYARVQQRALRYADKLSVVFENAHRFSAFPEEGSGMSWLQVQLRTVAKMISRYSDLSMSRQIFFVGVGGFDTHDDQLVNHPKLLADLDVSISAFYDAMVEIGMQRRVTLFTQSDFGRTLTSNGDGTDHGWGGVQLVVGDSVRGGAFYGEYPSLEIEGPSDIGSGVIVPTESSDQYVATLARWFGVSDRELSLVAPHIDNFTRKDLGFMG